MVAFGDASDAAGTTLTGERSGRVYRLTETLDVKLVGVNVEERKIDFVPVERESHSAVRPAGHLRRRRRG